MVLNERVPKVGKRKRSERKRKKSERKRKKSGREEKERETSSVLELPSVTVVHLIHVRKVTDKSERKTCLRTW